MPAERLSNHALLRTRDRDDACERIGAIFCPHRLEIAAGDALSVRHNLARLGETSVSHLDYGAAVRISPAPFGSFYLLQLPVAGKAELRWHDQQLVASASCGTLTNPWDEVDMAWDRECRKLIIRLDRRTVNQFAASYFDIASSQEITFDHAVDLTGAPGARLQRMVSHIVDELEQSASPLPPIVATQFEQTLLACLVADLPSSLRARCGDMAAGAAPRQVRRAEEFIRANAQEPLSLARLAAAAGTSIRSLQSGFRRYRGSTPLGYLKRVRLERAHADLQAPDGTETVSEIALRWGFSQFGRFAGHYREIYGEAPSRTLRRARFLPAGPARPEPPRSHR